MSISIGNKKLEKSVSEEDYSISFDIELNKGDFQLQTTMIDSKNNNIIAVLGGKYYSTDKKYKKSPPPFIIEWADGMQLEFMDNNK